MGDGVTKKERFVLAVMASAISRDIQDRRNVAGAVVANAFSVSERHINEADLSLADMVTEYIRYQYQTGPIPRIPQPDWLMTEEEAKEWGMG